MESLHHRMFLSFFPPPQFLSMPSVGVDVSDNSIKFLELIHTKDGFRVGRFGEKSIPNGIVVSGKIQNSDALVEILIALREEYDLHFVRVTLPEEQGYLFELELPNVSSTEMYNAIAYRLEENVPIAPEEAVFGFDILPMSKNKKEKRRAVVSVFPRAAIEAYTKLFRDAELVPLSLETEPQAIARSVVRRDDMNTCVVVDFGRQRSGISIVSCGVVQFGTTIEIGGHSLTQIFQEQYSDLSLEQIVELKNTKGLQQVTEENNIVFTEQVESIIHNLSKQIQKHVRYWNTHNEKSATSKKHVKKILLCGGNANLAGLPEYLSRELHFPVERANVWVNTFSLEQHIPAGISFQESLGYAPAIGLALHGVHPVMRDRHLANLLPLTHLMSVRHERRDRMIIVGLIGLFVVVLFSVGLLFPSMMLSHTKVKTAEKEIELIQTLIERREKGEILADVRKTSLFIERLEEEFEDVVFTDILMALARSTPSDVLISDISYTRNRDVQDTISIQGIAGTRDALLQLSKQIDREELFDDVRIPVSDLARSTNISFSLTFNVRTQEVEQDSDLLGLAVPKR